LITEPVKTRSVAVVAPGMHAAAGIDASGIVGAYFDSRQMGRLYSLHSVSTIIRHLLRLAPEVSAVDVGQYP